MGLSFIQEMNLITIFYQEILAKFWHNATRPKKVGTLIWLIFNKGFFMGSWLQQIGIEPTPQVCQIGLIEILQHCLMLCDKPRPL
jgi:hypothetical protein